MVWPIAGILALLRAQQFEIQTHQERLYNARSWCKPVNCCGLRGKGGGNLNTNVDRAMGASAASAAQTSAKAFKRVKIPAKRQRAKSTTQIEPLMR